MKKLFWVLICVGLIFLAMLFLFNKAAGAKAGEVLWKFEVTGQSLGSWPVLDDDGNIYFISKNDFYGGDILNFTPKITLFSLKPDGTERWRFEADEGYTGFLTISKDNIVYFSAAAKGEISIYAFDSDGTIKWKHKTPFFNSAPSTLLEETIYSIGRRNNIYSDGSSGGFLRLDCQKGTLIEEGDNFPLGFGEILSVGSQKEIYIYSSFLNEEQKKGKAILVLNQNQETRCLVKFENQTGVSWDWPVPAQPAIDYDGTLYFGTNKGAFYCVSPDGTIEWSRDFSIESLMEFSQPVLDDYNAYLISSGEAVAIRKADGRILWSDPYDYSNSHLLGADNTLYVLNKQEEAYIGRDLKRVGAIVALDSKNGERKWVCLFDERPVSAYLTISQKGIIYAVFYKTTHMGSSEYRYDSFIYAVDTGTGEGLADTAWPMDGRDAKHSNHADFEPDIPEIVSVEESKPANFSLENAYPNPFNPATTITYSLAEAGEAKLEIYNLAGQKVATLVQGWQTAGQHSVLWNASGLSSGIYFYTLKSGSAIQTKKVVLLK